jgi:hypothetical protein
MLKTFGAAVLLASALVITAGPAFALQAIVTQVEKHRWLRDLPLRRQVGPGETLAPGESKATADFVTVYNFYGLVEGSAKSPAGWEFSSGGLIPMDRVADMKAYSSVKRRQGDGQLIAGPAHYLIWASTLPG